MNRLFAALLLAAAPLFVTGAQAQINLITNGGFESFDSETNLPTGWQRQISDTEFLQFGAFTTAPFNCCMTFQTTTPITGTASLFASQNGPSLGAVWQNFTLPNVRLLSMTVRMTYGAQIGGETSADRVQIAIANADVLANDPSQAIRVLASVDGSAGPVDRPTGSLVVKLNAADIAALGRQPLALSFFSDGETFPALLVADDVSITFVPLIGTTTNQQSAAIAVFTSASGVLGAAGNTLLGLTGPQQDIALNHLGAPIYGDMLEAGLDRQRSFGAMLEHQLMTRRWGISLPMDGGADAVTRGKVSTWAAVIGGSNRFGSGGNTGASTTDEGVAVGADMMMTDTLRAGMAVAFVNGRTTARDTGGSSNGSTLMLAAYGGWSEGSVFLDGQENGSYHDQTVHRDLGAFGGGRTTSQVRGPGVSAGLEAGWRTDVAGFMIQPSASLRVDTVSRNRVTESGNDLALTADHGSATSARAGAGIRANRTLDLGSTSLGVTARLGFAYEMSDPRIRTNLAFLADGTAFTVINAKSGREIGQFDLGLTLPVTAGINAFATYATEIRRNYTGQGATAGVKIDF